MKKLVLLLAVVFSASWFSCGNAEKAAEAVDTAAVVEEVVAVVEDSACCADSACVAKCDTAAVKCNAACDSVK